MPAKQRLSRRSISVLRNFRTLAYLTLAPLDYVSRLVNGKADFPPLHLRRHVGPLRTFEASGSEFMSYLRLLVDLQPNESILDIGCGCGLMALYLRDYLDSRGTYTESIFTAINQVVHQSHYYHASKLPLRANQ
jgi:2-polyprenyl-3-methyl-5-hydroxy-6-metoxy-1,4-benzoquinol methylase